MACHRISYKPQCQSPLRACIQGSPPLTTVKPSLNTVPETKLWLLSKWCLKWHWRSRRGGEYLSQVKNTDRLSQTLFDILQAWVYRSRLPKDVQKRKYSRRGNVWFVWLPYQKCSLVCLCFRYCFDQHMQWLHLLILNWCRDIVNIYGSTTLKSNRCHALEQGILYFLLWAPSKLIFLEICL